MQHKKLSGVNLGHGEPLTTDDSLDRRDLVERMAWTARAFLWTFEGGVPSSRISDGHNGFNAPANPDVQATCFTVAGPAKQ